MSNRSQAAPERSVPPPGPPAAPGWGIALAACGLVLAAIAVYRDSFHGPFILDDPFEIEANGTIKHLWCALFPPVGSPAGGRPLLNFSFALNYALSDYKVWSYHALNLGIHVAATLTLFGFVRRTLAKPALARPFGRDSLPLAFLIAAAWAAHPLQTEAVTYLSQRAESLVGLFYLLTLYLFVRAGDSAKPAPWLAASVLACLLGALCKEIIATAPLLVLLYDRTFCSGSFRAAWRSRRRYYTALALVWPLLAWLSTGLSKRGVGFGQGVPWLAYALTSCRSVVLYLKLAVWPHPLVLDYGSRIFRDPVEVAPFALLLAVLLVGSCVALRRWPPVGFACAWFFLILAPTSSIVPVAGQPMAEHRMYLPLAAVVSLAVLGLYRRAGRSSAVPIGAAILALGWLSYERNLVYRSAREIWSDTVRKRPDSNRAHLEYGRVLSEEAGGLPQAISEYETSLRLNPGFAQTHCELGIALARTPGRIDDALAQFDEAIRIDPGLAQAHESKGITLAGIPGRQGEAIAEFRAALRADPDMAQAHNDLGIALARMPGRQDEAIAEYGEALRINPGFAEAHNDLGAALSGIPGRGEDAIAEYRAAIRIKPEYPEAHYNLGIALSAIPGRMPEAIAEYEDALRIRPDYAEAHNKLGISIGDMPGRLPEAIGHFREAVRIDPGFVAAHDNLGMALSRDPASLAEAISELEVAIRLKPDDAEGHNDLGVALTNLPGRLPEAIVQFEEALRIRPDDKDARRNLDLARQLQGQSPGGGR